MSLPLRWSGGAFDIGRSICPSVVPASIWADIMRISLCITSVHVFSTIIGQRDSCIPAMSNTQVVYTIVAEPEASALVLSQERTQFVRSQSRMPLWQTEIQVDQLSRSGPQSYSYKERRLCLGGNNMINSPTALYNSTIPKCVVLPVKIVPFAPDVETTPPSKIHLSIKTAVVPAPDKRSPFAPDSLICNFEIRTWLH